MTLRGPRPHLWWAQHLIFNGPFKCVTDLSPFPDHQSGVLKGSFRHWSVGFQPNIYLDIYMYFLQRCRIFPVLFSAVENNL